MDDATLQKATLDERDELLLASIVAGTTITAAAEHVGIGRPAASGRVNRPEFQAALAERRAEIRAATQEQLIHSAKQALDTLNDVMADVEARDSDRVAAARVVVGVTIPNPQRLEITGHDGGPVRIAGLEAMRAAARERIEVLSARYEEKPAAIAAGGNGNGDGHDDQGDQ